MTPKEILKVEKEIVLTLKNIYDPEIPVNIYDLGLIYEIDYTPDLFKYGTSGVKGKDLPKNLGFAGFRFRYHTDWARDLVAFLGASYFRAVGGEMQYGMSARGLEASMSLPASMIARASR